MRIRSDILTHEHPREDMARRILCAAIALCACAYVYFVGASALNVIARKEAQRDIRMLQSTIGQLEQSYFALNDSVSPALALEMGLAPISGTHYVQRPGSILAANVTR